MDKDLLLRGRILRRGCKKAKPLGAGEPLDCSDHSSHGCLAEKWKRQAKAHERFCGVWWSVWILVVRVIDGSTEMSGSFVLLEREWTTWVR
jgi:hypothetical protein